LKRCALGSARTRITFVDPELTIVWSTLAHEFCRPSASSRHHQCRDELDESNLSHNRGGDQRPREQVVGLCDSNSIRPNQHKP
jgi:hypothetical protein